MSYPQTRILTGGFVLFNTRTTGGKMFALGMEPTVFTTNTGTEQIKQHDPVFKYDVTGTDNRDYVQYQIMMTNKTHWSVLDCIGNQMMTGYETPLKALQALEAHLNKTYGFIAAPTNQITQ
ncbi:MAG: hypothetical protein LAO78_12185 [Acidobacteriia bacterium]|jgi:hypothetical protein|nr:hypothetical protein [Terriglobia bacterium]